VPLFAASNVAGQSSDLCWFSAFTIVPTALVGSERLHKAHLRPIVADFFDALHIST
jgi:hypothetical protein